MRIVRLRASSSRSSYLNEWLMGNGFQGQDGKKAPEMTETIVNQITERYIELFENITGDKFVKAEGTDVVKRIERNVTEFLGKQ